MRDYLKFYIGGAWVDPAAPKKLDVINPATEAPAGRISMGGAADVDRAVAAARAAFETFSQTTREERIDLLQRILSAYEKRYQDVAAAITEEMGAPAWLSSRAQAGTGVAHLKTAIEVLKTYKFEELRCTTMLLKEPIGVCGFITPWNWPINQIVCKVAPALATGCTMVLKPSEIAPFSGYLFAEILHDAGVPAGVFNLVNGDGPTVGAALAAHPGVDMVSFTGSTRAGIEVAKNAAPTVKRVHQELGGKSPNIILDDADFKAAVSGGVKQVMLNSGQSCNAPSRLFVEEAIKERFLEKALAMMPSFAPGDPLDENTVMGAIVDATQLNTVMGYIEAGKAGGARLLAGGARVRDGTGGYFVEPTLFDQVESGMTIAREEIFGPVLSVLSFTDLNDAIRQANGTVYGLHAAVWTSDLTKAVQTSRALRAGTVHVNQYDNDDITVPFGGYKQSGNGRDKSLHAFDKYTELKTTWIQIG